MIFSKSFPVNVFASRKGYTDYTNNSDMGMMVTVSGVDAHSGGTTALVAYVRGEPVATSMITDAPAGKTTITFYVPPRAVYRVNNGTTTLQLWTETLTSKPDAGYALIKRTGVYAKDIPYVNTTKYPQLHIVSVRAGAANITVGDKLIAAASTDRYTLIYPLVVWVPAGKALTVSGSASIYSWYEYSLNPIADIGAGIFNMSMTGVSAVIDTSTLVSVTGSNLSAVTVTTANGYRTTITSPGVAGTEYPFSIKPTAAVTTAIGTVTLVSGTVTKVNEWHASGMGVMKGFTKITSVPQYAPPNTKSLSYMFADNLAVPENVKWWNVSNVTDFTYMFKGATFVGIADLSAWNVKSALKMENMFNAAANFTSDLSQWCVVNILTAPTGFSTGSGLTEAKLPVWGTCPRGEAVTNFDAQPSGNLIDNYNITRDVNYYDLFVARVGREPYQNEVGELHIPADVAIVGSSETVPGILADTRCNVFSEMRINNQGIIFGMGASPLSTYQADNFPQIPGSRKPSGCAIINLSSVELAITNSGSIAGGGGAGSCMRQGSAGGGAPFGKNGRNDSTASLLTVASIVTNDKTHPATAGNVAGKHATPYLKWLPAVYHVNLPAGMATIGKVRIENVNSGTALSHNGVIGNNAQTAAVIENPPGIVITVDSAVKGITVNDAAHGSANDRTIHGVVLNMFRGFDLDVVFKAQTGRSPTVNDVVTVIIPADSILVGLYTSTGGINIPSTFTAKEVNIINYGYVIGIGGRSTNYVSANTPAAAGNGVDNASTTPVKVFNFGTVAGGGGAGAGLPLVAAGGGGAPFGTNTVKTWGYAGSLIHQGGNDNSYDYAGSQYTGLGGNWGQSGTYGGGRGVPGQAGLVINGAVTLTNYGAGYTLGR